MNFLAQSRAILEIPHLPDNIQVGKPDFQGTAYVANRRRVTKAVLRDLVHDYTPVLPKL